MTESTESNSALVLLTPDEARVVGVLIEKGITTPAYYPLTLNAIVDGANQKNNRDPIFSLDENRAFDALTTLRDKGLIMRVDLAGSRVPKYRHLVDEKLQVSKAPMVILAELLLRGPQTLGELRGRASRMYPFETLEAARAALDILMQRQPALAKQIAALPGSRAERYVQLMAPEAHPIGATASAAVENVAVSGASVESLSQRVERLEGELASLKAVMERIATALGEDVKGA